MCTAFKRVSLVLLSSYSLNCTTISFIMDLGSTKNNYCQFLYNFIYTLNEIDSGRDSFVWSHMSGGGGGGEVYVPVT